MGRGGFAERKKKSPLTALRTTGQLVKTNEASICKPIRDIVRIVVLLERSESKYVEN